METSKVYFTDFKTSMYENLLKKLHRFLRRLLLRNDLRMWPILSLST